MALRRSSPGTWRRFGLVLNALVVLSMLLSPVSVGVAAPQPTPTVAPGGGPAQTPTPLPPTPTPTIAPLAGVSPSATPTMTPTLTPAAVPTPTLGPPASPTPVTTRTISSSPALSLSKAVTPQAAPPGSVVTFTLTVSNAGPGAAHDLALRDPLPKQLKYIGGSAPGAAYDAKTKTLTWTLPSLEPGQTLLLTFQARVAGRPGSEVANTATLLDGLGAPIATATATLAVGHHPGPGQLLVTPGEGGEVVSPDGRVRVYIPPGAVSEPVLVSLDGWVHHPWEPWAAPVYEFELEVEAVDDGEPLPLFAIPVTATVLYYDAEIQGLVEDDLHLIRHDEDLAAWPALPSVVDPEANLVEAQLTHTGLFGLTAEEEVFFLPRLEAGQVDLFSGDAAFDYELEVPAGAGGLHVPLSLRYSSRIPNSMQGEDNSDSGWVGVGWVLEMGKIEGSASQAYLTLDGLSAWLSWMENVSSQDSSERDWDLPESEDAYEGTRIVNRYVTGPNHSFLKIQSDLFSGTSPSNQWQVTGLGHWEVWGKDGTHYVFGSQPYTPHGPGDPPVVRGTGSRLSPVHWAGQERSYRSWKLDRIVDPHGNEVRIVYEVYPTRRVDETRSNLKESYPSHIYYTTNATTGDDHAEYDVEFVVGKKEFDLGSDERLAETGFELEAIKVWYQREAGSERVLVRQYVFEQEAIHHGDGRHYRLQSIRQCADEACAEALPPTTFSYHYDAQHRIGWRVGNPGQTQQRQRPFLATVDNGYGGQVTFAYEDYCLDEEGEYACGDDHDIGRLKRQRAASRRLTPGIGAEMESAYSYGEPGYRWHGDDYRLEFIGFGRAVEDDLAAGQVARQEESRFHNTMEGGNGDPWHARKGRVLETWLRDGQGALYAHTTVEYVDYQEEDWPDEVFFVYAAQVVAETCGSGTCRDKKTSYSYDPEFQNYFCEDAEPLQLGNLTHVAEYASSEATTPYRTTVTAYCPNTTDWIVNRAASVNVYEGDADGTLASSTQYIYGEESDGPYWNLPPDSQGEMRGVRLYAGPGRFVDTRYEYDDYGNVDRETVYNSYGSDHEWASADGRTTATDYDDEHNTFPVRVTQPEVAGVTLQESREYYGVNESDEGQGEGLPGQLKRVRDQNNGLDTWQQYDAFGRLLYRWLPGDGFPEQGQAGQRYAYDDALRWQRTWQRDDDGTGTASYLESYRFYDGLGRPIQAQAEVDLAANEMVVVSSYYDALGREEGGTVPRGVDDGAFGALYAADFPADPGQRPPGTRVEYDALGRPLVVTNPDGTFVQHFYSGWRESVYDENDHVKAYERDAFERLVKVQEYEDLEPGLGLYATTSYAYDVRDNLEAVYDANAHDGDGNLLPDPPYETTIEYDLLGRKTAMHDPDMGDWGYEYDALGNLATQTDARGWVIGFAYDELNRLLSKDYGADGSAEAEYYYDGRTCSGCATPGGRVYWQQTAVWTADSWTVYHHADGRGRLSGEELFVAGGGTFVTGYSYDAADRLLSMSYPDEEQVNLGYDDQGLAATLTGDAAYVSAAEYNGLGQMTLLDFGPLGVWWTSYIYYPAGEGNNRLQRILAQGAVPLLDLRYTYDSVGNVETITDGNSGEVQRFAYDELDRLTGATDAYGASYEYSPIGNLETKTEGGTTYLMQYTDLAHVHAPRIVNGQPYLYDANGNLLEGGGRTLTWDEENRLQQATYQGQTTVFTYDANGALVRKEVGGETIVYVGQYHERNVTTGQETNYYYFNGRRVAMRQGSVVTFIHADHLGSTRVLSNNTGNVVGDVIRYYPYGAARVGDVGTLPTDYLFTGQRHEDPLGGLYHMGARFIDPATGRWLSPDTIVPSPANPQSLNRYSYGYNNPLVHVDPSGHQPREPMIEGTWGIGYEFILNWLKAQYPPPEGYYWAKAAGFVINEYYTPEESAFSGEKIDSAVGLEGIGSFKEDFLYNLSGVAGQGTGVADDGTVIGVVRNPRENWSADWTIIDRSAVEFGVKGNIEDENVLAKPMSRVAVNPIEGAIPRGARVYIFALDVQLADHEGFVKASDHSTALDPYEMDFYSGVGRASMSGPPTFNFDNYTIYFLRPY